jgi:hypothetical protein
MLGLRKKEPNLPTPPFQHAAGCRIVRADPGFDPPWQEVEERHWRRECQCGAEDYRQPQVDRRGRLDPRDPATARHLGQCEFASETDRDKLRLALKVKPGLEPGYDWVECSGCDCGWQVPHYAAESVG